MCVVCVMYEIVHRYVYVACVLYVLCMTSYIICTYVLCVCVFIIIFLYYFFAFIDPLFEQLGTLTDLKLLSSL